MWATIVSFFTGLPSIFSFLGKVWDAIVAATLKSKEQSQKQGTQQAADDVQKAQESGDAQSQQNALDHAVDEYNR